MQDSQSASRGFRGGRPQPSEDRWRVGAADAQPPAYDEIVLKPPTERGEEAQVTPGTSPTSTVVIQIGGGGGGASGSPGAGQQQVVVATSSPDPNANAPRGTTQMRCVRIMKFKL